MGNYKSTTAIYPHCVDSRSLCMEANYFLLTKEQATGFARGFVEWCAALWQKDFVITWHFDNRNMTLARVLEAIGKDGLLGVLTGGLTATAGGIAAAMIFGLIVALIFRPKDKGD